MIRTIFLLLMAATTVVHGEEQAPTASATPQAQIAPQSVDAALAALARQSGLQFIYGSDAVRGLQSKGAPAGLSAAEALMRVLDGTGLSYEFLNERTVTVFAIGEGKDRGKVSGAVTEAVGTMRVAQGDAGGSGGSVAEVGSEKTQEGDEESAAAKDSEGKLEEIVVTAQKREERLKDVPMSISVLTGYDLDRSTSQGITEALRTVPSVIAQESYAGGGTQVAIRGVAASGPILLGSSPIAYYIDSVPFGLINTSIGPDANAYDLERVEVLRGPQGTLYGASALNGVVRVLTKDADLDDTEFKGRGSISSTEDGSENYRADIAANVPIVPGKLAVRAVAGYDNPSGWVDRPNRENSNDAKLRNWRLKVNGQPNDALSIGLSAWMSRADYGATSESRDDRTHTSLHADAQSTDYEVYGLKIGYNFSGASLTSSTGYMNFENHGSLDLTPWIGLDTPFLTDFYAHVFSQEVVLNSASSAPWRWSVGAIYRDEKDRNLQFIQFIYAAPADYNVTSESFAVFGELTRSFAEGRFELTGGIRYFEDRTGTDENQPSTGIPGDLLTPTKAKFDAATPRVVLNWHPNDQLTVYASYGEGFRSGFQQAPNVIRASNLAPVDADSLKNYEIGTKAGLWNGRLSLETAVYYIDWKDVQNQFGVEIGGGVTLGAVTNSGSASGIGVDFAVTTQPARGLTLGANVGWNDLKWDNNVFYQNNVVLFEKGARLNLSPEYMAGASVDYAFPLGGSGFLGRLAASGNYISKQDFRTNFGFGASDSILIARTAFTLESAQRWSATLYADNLTDEDGAVVRPPFGVEDWNVRTRPRTVGVQLELKF